jgi:hypothetical protein
VIGRRNFGTLCSTPLLSIDPGLPPGVFPLPAFTALLSPYIVVVAFPLRSHWTRQSEMQQGARSMPIQVSSMRPQLPRDSQTQRQQS